MYIVIKLQLIANFEAYKDVHCHLFKMPLLVNLFFPLFLFDFTHLFTLETDILKKRTKIVTLKRILLGGSFMSLRNVSITKVSSVCESKFDLKEQHYFVN